MTQLNRGYLRHLREEAGLSQAALAKQIGIGASSLSTYERNGRPVPPDVLAAIEAVCAPAQPSFDVPRPDPQAQGTDDPDAPLVVVDQRGPCLEPPPTPALAVPQCSESGEMPDDRPPLPSPVAPVTYTLADLEALARAYGEQVCQKEVAEGMHPSVYDDTEGVLSAFLAHLATLEQATRAAHTFAIACAILAQTGDVGAYTAAVLAAQQAGLTPERIADLMRKAFRTVEAWPTGGVRLLHEGNAPWVREPGKGN